MSWSISIVDAPAAALGEGIHWCQFSNSISWVDINNNTLFVLNCESQKVEVLPLDYQATAIVGSDYDSYTVVSNIGISKIAKNGQLKSFFAFEEESIRNRPNDGVMLNDGSIIFGTMHPSGAKMSGALYWFFEDELFLLEKGYLIPNGFAVDLNNNSIVIADSGKQKIYRYKLNFTNRSLNEKCELIDLSYGTINPDGMQICSDGSFWCAHWAAAELVRYSHDGEMLERIILPALQPTNCTFQGGNENILYVTSAYEGLNVAELRSFPASGKLMKLVRT